jgi:uncharacterized membrane protein
MLFLPRYLALFTPVFGSFYPGIWRGSCSSSYYFFCVVFVMFFVIVVFICLRPMSFVSKCCQCRACPFLIVHSVFSNV